MIQIYRFLLYFSTDLINLSLTVSCHVFQGPILMVTYFHFALLYDSRGSSFWNFRYEKLSEMLLQYFSPFPSTGQQWSGQQEYITQSRVHRIRLLMHVLGTFGIFFRLIYGVGDVCTYLYRSNREDILWEEARYVLLS